MPMTYDKFLDSDADLKGPTDFVGNISSDADLTGPNTNLTQSDADLAVEPCAQLFVLTITQ